MAPCDCSNCKPEEAEALWLAQAALTSQNFDAALEMETIDLQRLLEKLPGAPPAPPSDPRPVPILFGDDDPIRTSPLLETLVTRLDRDFNNFYFALYQGPSDLGPADYFGRDLAWLLAKNVDLLGQSSNIGVVLASEVIPGQFEILYSTFVAWKLEFNTDATIAAASQIRQSSFRPTGPLKPPQSVEGIGLSKAHADAEKKALKEARDLNRLLASQAKANARARREQAKMQLTKRTTAKRCNPLAATLASKRVAASTGDCVARKRRAADPPVRIPFLRFFLLHNQT